MRTVPPQRRLRLLLDIGADDLDALAAELRMIANDLEHEERETREITSGGYSSGYHLALSCDADMDGDTFREQLSEWMSERRASRSPDQGGQE